MSLLVVEAETLRSGNSGVGVRKEEVQGERGRHGDKGGWERDSIIIDFPIN